METRSYIHLLVRGTFSVLINVPLPRLSIIKQAEHTMADVTSILCGLLKRLPWQHRVVRHWQIYYSCNHCKPCWRHFVNLNVWTMCNEQKTTVYIDYFYGFCHKWPLIFICKYYLVIYMQTHIYVLIRGPQGNPPSSEAAVVISGLRTSGSPEI